MSDAKIPRSIVKRAASARVAERAHFLPGDADSVSSPISPLPERQSVCLLGLQRRCHRVGPHARWKGLQHGVAACKLRWTRTRSRSRLKLIRFPGVGDLIVSNDRGALRRELLRVVDGYQISFTQSGRSKSVISREQISRQNLTESWR
jgi:hypothetical protein